MKAGRKLAVVFVLVLAGSAVLASQKLLATVTGTGIQTWTGTNGASVAIQCPGISVFYRPGAGASDTVDAGTGDVAVDFTVNTDPYRVKLAPNEDRIHLKKSDATSFTCYVYRDSP